MNSGISLEEIKRLFNYLEENKANDNLQIIMTTEGCHDLYKLFIDFNKYQKLLETRINKSIKLLEEDYFEDGSGNNIEEVIKILKGEENE